jgi:hypothetical protein
MRDTDTDGNLLSTLEIEYYKWVHNNTGSDYRYDPLTGGVWKDRDCPSSIFSKTYFICNSEYPVYDIYGEYVGHYFSGKFYKPLSRNDMDNLTKRKDALTTPWEQMKEKVIEPESDSVIEHVVKRESESDARYTYTAYYSSA